MRLPGFRTATWWDVIRRILTAIAQPTHHIWCVHGPNDVSILDTVSILRNMTFNINATPVSFRSLFCICKQEFVHALLETHTKAHWWERGANNAHTQNTRFFHVFSKICSGRRPVKGIVPGFRSTIAWCSLHVTCVHQDELGGIEQLLEVCIVKDWAVITIRRMSWTHCSLHATWTNGLTVRLLFAWEGKWWWGK